MKVWGAEPSNCQCRGGLRDVTGWQGEEAPGRLSAERLLCTGTDMATLSALQACKVRRGQG